MKEKEKKPLKERLLNKYRLVILNEETYEERISYRLNRLNIFLLMAFMALIIIITTICLIAFTSIKEYIPGYASTSLKKQATFLNYKTDSLLQAINTNEKYLRSIKRVLTGEISAVEINKDSVIKAAEKNMGTIVLDPSIDDLKLREKVDEEDRYSLFESATSKTNFVLFPPAKGKISNRYNLKEKHFAVDIVLAQDTPVKATSEGTVIFAEWTAQTGYVMIIDHGNGLLSVYKHNSSLTKNQGALVKSGEVIAISGNSGELTTGPHLHFELWYDGYPINPTTFIDFE